MLQAEVELTTTITMVKVIIDSNVSTWLNERRNAGKTTGNYVLEYI